MAAPAERFSTAAARAEEDLLPLRLPAVIALVAAPAAEPEPVPRPSVPAAWQGGPVEFDRVVPPSGNMEVLGKQFWLGTTRAGMTVTFWASVDVIHLSIAGARVKSVRSHLSTAGLARLAASGGRAAGPPPIPAAQPGSAIEVDRVVSKDGAVSLGGRYHIAAEILGGHAGLHPHRGNHPDVLRPRNPRAAADPAQPADLGPGPAPPRRPPRRTATTALREPVTVQRRASNTGVIMVVGQKIALGRIHAGQIVTVHVAEDTMTIDLGGDDIRTIRRTTTQPVRSIKAHRPRKAAHVS